MLNLITMLSVLTITLQGFVSNSDEPGKFGFDWNSFTHTVVRVHKGSPADEEGILPGDKIIEVDGDPHKQLDDYAGLPAILTILRKDVILKIVVIRVPNREINWK